MIRKLFFHILFMGALFGPIFTMAQEHLTLYYRPNCPFCTKVFKTLKKLDIEIELKDLNSNQEFQAELIEIGGKRQVPCLVIDGKAKYESQDIISYLKSMG